MLKILSTKGLKRIGKSFNKNIIANISKFHLKRLNKLYSFLTWMTILSYRETKRHLSNKSARYSSINKRDFHQNLLNKLHQSLTSKVQYKKLMKKLNRPNKRYKI